MYDVLVVVTATACGLTGGVFAAFSTFVMAGLGRLADPEGVRAMQAVNQTAVRPAFMALFLGTTVLSLGLGVWAVARSDVWSLLGAVVYVLGCFVVTAAASVPLNNRVAAVDADEQATHHVWRDYQVRWTRWNHLRTASGALACALLAVGLLSR